MYPLSSTAHHVCPCSYPVPHPPSIVYTSFWSCLFPDRDAPGCLPQLSAFEPVSSMAFLTWPSFLPSSWPVPTWVSAFLVSAPTPRQKMCFGPTAPAQWSMAQAPSVGVLGGWGMNLFSFSQGLRVGMHPPPHSLWVSPSPGSWIPFSPNLQKGGCQLGTPEGWRAQCLLRSEFRG